MVFTLTTTVAPLIEVPVETEPSLGAPDLVEHDVRLSFGVPKVAQLTPAAIRASDPTLAEFVEHANADFYHCQLTCSMAGGEGIRVERATLRLALHEDAVHPSTPAIVWSMAPLQLTKRSPQPLGGSAQVGFGPFLKIAGRWADDIDRERCYVRALGEGESKSEWRYTRQPEVPLDGAYRMDAVIRLPRNRAIHAQLALTGTGRRRRLGLFPFRARLEPQQSQLDISP